MLPLELLLPRLFSVATNVSNALSMDITSPIRISSVDSFLISNVLTFKLITLSGNWMLLVPTILSRSRSTLPLLPQRFPKARMFPTVCKLIRLPLGVTTAVTDGQFEPTMPHAANPNPTIRSTNPKKGFVAKHVSVLDIRPTLAFRLLDSWRFVHGLTTTKAHATPC